MPTQSDSIRKAFEEALVATIEIRQGFIYSVDDDPKNPIVKFPEDNLPAGHKKKPKRSHHRHRYVLVVQSDVVNKDNSFLSVLVAALSSRSRETDFTVLIPTEDLIDRIPGDSHALVHLTQPILKIFLREKVGELPANGEAMKKVRAIYLRVVGLI